jgi:hypothetical protein
MTFRILTEALLCGLPIVFLFLSLYQISSWKINMFRWGIVIFTFSEPFPVKIPTHLTNRIIEYKGLTFKFVSRKLGLFQSKIIGRRLILRDEQPTSGIFPLLGEITLYETGVAKVILRIPNSVIFLFIGIITALIGLKALSKDGGIDISSIIMGMFPFFIFIAFGLFVEKTQLEYGVQKIKEYILENT